MTRAVQDARLAAARQAMGHAAMAAMDVAEQVSDGRLSPASLEAQAVEECRALVGMVDGPADPLWELHVSIARQVLAVGGIPAAELAEWAAVQAAAEPAPPTTSWIVDALAAMDDDDEGDRDA